MRIACALGIIPAAMAVGCSPFAFTDTHFVQADIEKYQGDGRSGWFRRATVRDPQTIQKLTRLFPGTNPFHDLSTPTEWGVNEWVAIGIKFKRADGSVVDVEAKWDEQQLDGEKSPGHPTAHPPVLDFVDSLLDQQTASRLARRERAE
jgi:hypothetical protein